MREVFYSSVSSPIGTIWVASDHEGICLLDIGGDEREFLREVGKRGWQPRADGDCNVQVTEELRAYFAGHLTRFSIHLNPQGGAFDRQVWAVLQKIPLGETRSYQDVARAIGNPCACRAVGGANRRNPIPLIIPCHRVIRKNGEAGGFSSGQEIKKWLLRFERRLSGI
jgi:methylated-DNA-[protein]-cysteine S-methyltransferase